MSDRESLSADLRNRASLLLQSSRHLLNAHPDVAETPEGQDLDHQGRAFLEAWDAYVSHVHATNAGDPPPDPAPANDPTPPALGFRITE